MADGKPCVEAARAHLGILLRPTTATQEGDIKDRLDPLSMLGHNLSRNRQYHLMPIRDQRMIFGPTRPRYLAELVGSASGEATDWHSHSFGQLISSISGTMYVGTETHVLLLSPAMAIWIPPDAGHWMRTSSNNEMLYVDVNRAEAVHLGQACRVIAMTPLLNALMRATLPDVARSAAHHNTLHDLLQKELVVAPDVPLSLVLPRDSRIRPLALSALNNPGDIVSIQRWLSSAPTSRKTIERLFVSQTGMSPARWLKHARVLHAISRLASGEKISSVALDMGYESASAFGYMFRKSIGQTPGMFRPPTPELDNK
ncbi:helix-turn-helix transcriptional regulator [Paracoccus caeni]|uniref:Helix-turn-helix transcriptional regulator n=1 Tax=Paracoccus caeni TaxID=657651 RepID=A0A934VYQ2_9RHOB|nr:helix-turn-helix transcriptional regulator [Paracoccus caeni]MBK4216242.1 helix-turn-helix transcriptional regulator [Paracoccus caeni]